MDQYPTTPIGIEQAAGLADCEPALVQELLSLRLLDGDTPSVADVTAIRLFQSLAGAGIGPAQVAEAVRQGRMSTAFMRSLLPEPVLMSDQSCEAAIRARGLEPAMVERLFVAAGLPRPELRRRARQDEVLFIDLLGRGIAFGLPEPAIARILRVFGHSTRRTALAMRDLFREAVEARYREQETIPAAALARAAQDRVPLQQLGLQVLHLLQLRFVEEAIFENVMLRVEHVLGALGLIAAPERGFPAIAFADLVGFTTLTRERGDQAAVAAVAQLEAVAQEVMVAFGGRIIKSLGDGLVLYLDDADRAPSACATLLARARGERLPQLRIGLTAGPVMFRDGDVFGATVNLASRLSTVAPPAEIASNDKYFRALPKESWPPWHCLGEIELKGVGQERIWARGEEPLGTDDAGSAAARVRRP